MITYTWSSNVLPWGYLPSLPSKEVRPTALPFSFSQFSSCAANKTIDLRHAFLFIQALSRLLNKGRYRFRNIKPSPNSLYVTSAHQAAIATRLTSALSGLAPALPASVTLDDEEDGDQSDSATYRDDAQTAECVSGSGPRVRHRVCIYIYSLSHLYRSTLSKFTLPRQTRQNCLVRVVYASAVWTGFSTTQGCRRQKIWSLNTFKAIVRFMPAHQTRHRQDRLVVSGVAVWIGSARPTDKCVLGRSVSGGADSACATAGRTPTQNALVGRSDRLNSHRLTLHRHDRLVLSGGRCELGISYLWTSPRVTTCMSNGQLESQSL